MKKKFKSYILIIILCIASSCLTWLIMKKSKSHKNNLILQYSEIIGCAKSRFHKENSQLFSQYYEDYILSEIFRDVEKGFYVDVGANQPILDNATYFFYKKGWDGLVIEPIKELHQKFQEVRPRDIALNVAVSNHDGFATLHSPISGDGISTLENNDYNARGIKVREINVRLMTLNQVFAENKLHNVNILKIDIEGHEASALQGLDLKLYRPEVIVIESVSPVDFYGYLSFEKILIENNYLLGMSDSLNRYYYPRELHDRMKDKFLMLNTCVKLDQFRRNVYCINPDLCTF